jgi:gamma-glutamylcyclotransferase (GGCT)/AIG2-like uncharacterized protein YtfP
LPPACTDLFVYGTLLDDALVVQLTGRRFTAQAARLHGYRKIEVSDYPGIVADATAVVDGRLLRGVDAAALAVLDGYEEEGRLYRRTSVVVEVGRTRRRAQAYIAITGAPEQTSPGR